MKRKRRTFPTVNLNERVRVKLNDRGVELIANDFPRGFNLTSYNLRAAKDGRTLTGPLWGIMNAFGRYTKFPDEAIFVKNQITITEPVNGWKDK